MRHSRMQSARHGKEMARERTLHTAARRQRDNALLRAWNDGARPAQVTAEWFDACCVGMPLDIGILNWRGAGANPRPDGAFSRCNVPTRPAPFDSLLQVTDIRRELVNVLSLAGTHTMAGELEL